MPVAWIAHLGGFIAGIVLFPLFDFARSARRRWPGAPAPAALHGGLTAFRAALRRACLAFGRRRRALRRWGTMILPTIDPLIAGGVVVTTAFTDACLCAIQRRRFARRRFAAASWSSVWYLLAAFAVISYTSNWVYVLFPGGGGLMDRRVSVDHCAQSHRSRCVSVENAPDLNSLFILV